MNLPFAASPLTILLEDNHCLALAKPAPLLTQGPAGVPSLEALAKEYLKQKYNKPGNVYLGVPHRLDRAVSGVVLFARNSKAASRLAEQFEKRQAAKVYWGIVDGHVDPPEGTWQDWLLKIKDEARAEKAAEGTPGARLAELHYRLLQRGPDVGDREGDDLVEFQPLTGRMHQIRLQTALRGWPIRGDVLYGSKREFAAAGPLPRDRIIALHGRSLTFLHPLSYQPVTLVAPLPDYWREFGDPCD
jgi:23S rRNA pseudouridine1911/1915/1917 synthase